MLQWTLEGLGEFLLGVYEHVPSTLEKCLRVKGRLAGLIWRRDLKGAGTSH